MLLRVPVAVHDHIAVRQPRHVDVALAVAINLHSLNTDNNRRGAADIPSNWFLGLEVVARPWARFRVYGG